MKLLKLYLPGFDINQFLALLLNNATARKSFSLYVTFMSMVTSRLNALNVIPRRRKQ